MKYVYPAVFCPNELGGYCIRFPDIKDAFTQGNDLAESIALASDVLNLVLYHYESENKQIPCPSKAKDITTENDEFVTLIAADTAVTRRQNENKLVNKTLCIPSWLNEKATTAGINFSQTLQTALKENLQLASAE